MYDEPDFEKPCFKCEYYEYDTFQDELYCGHDPLAEFINNRGLIDKWGTCEYWKITDAYKN